MSLEHQLISKDDLLNLNSIENVIALFNKCGFNDFEYLNKPFLGLIFTISEDEQKYIEVHITSKDKIHSYNTRLSPKVRYLFIITDVFQRFMFVTKKIIRVFGKGREKIVRFIFWKNDLKNDEKATIILQRMNALTINNLDTFDNLIHKNISELDAINLLKQCMSIIRNEMDNLDESKETALEEKTGFFYARKMNKDSLINEELIMRFKRDIKSAASYILVDQLFFYHLLQINNPDKFSNPLDEQEGDDPSIFDNFFEDVKKIDYLSVYETNLLEILPKKSSIVVALNQVIRLIVDTAIDELPQDLLGRIFHNMIPLDIRKPLAAFYTSNPSARLLSTLSITKPDMKILDLACGSGTLLVSAYIVKDQLYQNSNSLMSSNEKHSRILSEIYGNDVSMFAAHLATINLAIQNLSQITDKVNITTADGLEIQPGESLVRLSKFLYTSNEIRAKRQYKSRSLDGEETEITFPKVDCILMNPPFSRQTGMDPNTVQRLNQLMERKFGNQKDTYVDNKMGLHGYFLLHSDDFLDTNGIIAMVLPASTFSTEYTSKLLKFLNDKKYLIEFVIEILTNASAFSEECTFKEFLVILRKGKLLNNSVTNLVTIKKEFTNEQVNEIIGAIKSKRDYSLIITKTLETSVLYNSTNWIKLFTVSTTELDNLFNSTKFQLYNKNFNDLTLTRGYDATYSDYLMLPNKEWDLKEGDNEFQLINKNTKNYCKIPRKFLILAIRSSEYANEVENIPKHYVLNLDVNISNDKDMKDFVDIYITYCTKKLNEKWENDKQKGHRRKEIPTTWYAHANKNQCSNTTGKLFLPFKYQPTVRKTLTPYSEKEVTVNHGLMIFKTAYPELYASWTNSGLFLYLLFQNHQIIHKDYFKVAIKDFNKILFPKSDIFKEVSELVKVFRNLASNKNLPFLPIQFKEKVPERVALDKTWLKALDVQDKDIPEILDKLYTWLINYFENR